MNLHGANVLITGGRRLGSALASTLATRGANLAFTYFSQREPIETAAAKCRAFGAKTLTIAADLRDPSTAARVVEQVVSAWNRMDVLVNLTSVYTRTPFATLTPEASADMFASNLLAPYAMAVAVGQQMQRQALRDGLQGKILHFTDWAVDRPYRDFLPYLVAKGGLVTLTKALAVELGPTILVNAIAPGTVAPPPHLTPEAQAAIARTALLARNGQPSDVVAAALYLLEGTDFVTGEVYRVDGGRFLGSSSATCGDD